MPGQCTRMGRCHLCTRMLIVVARRLYSTDPAPQRYVWICKVEHISMLILLLSTIHKMQPRLMGTSLVL